MTGFLLSLLSAFSAATADALTKGRCAHLTPYGMGLTRLLYTLPWLALCWPLVPEVSPDPVFYRCVAAAVPLELLAFVWYMKAIRTSPLSLCIPLLAFTPVFLVGTGWVLLGEVPRPGGLLGILLVVAGSYVLSFSETRRGLLGPFRAIWAEPGPRRMLGVSALYAVTAPLGKLAVLHSHPLYFACFYFTVLPAAMLLLLPFQGRNRPKGRLLARPGAGLPVGLAMAVMVVSHMAAIVRIPAAYMITLKRTSLLFSVLYGAIWFREERIRERLAGALVMVAGVALIGWKG
jgi:drug/metabolite transporter (DMT)-like permease